MILPAAPPRALIFGVSGQDGSWLAEFLLNKGYDVHGASRPHAIGLPVQNISAGVLERIHLAGVDITDAAAVRAVIEQVSPDEIYNLAAVSHVGSSWESVEAVWRTNVLGFLNILETVREHGRRIKVYQASSSEMYGNVASPQSELTPFRPVSPYGASKVAAHNLAAIYRRSHGMFIACGICHNHESERRSPMFVSRKVARAVAQIVHGLADSVTLGDLTPRRDWGYAPDYVEAMWLMLQQDMPDDFVVATGVSHSVEELVQSAFAAVGLLDWQQYVVKDASMLRPTEIARLVGSWKKAERALGWRPITGFHEFIRKMVEHEVEILKEAR